MDWIDHIQARGLEHVVHTALDVLEPLGPLGAQLVWVAQPAAHILGRELWGEALAALAEALEKPDGITKLRERLEGQQHG